MYKMFELSTYYYKGDFTITFYVTIFIIIILIIISRDFLYYMYFGFTKTITVRKTYTRNRSRNIGDEYFVITTDNVVYKIDNLWFKLDFNRADDWANLIKNQTYKVNGYGFRLSALDMYPKIYSIEKV